MNSFQEHNLYFAMLFQITFLKLTGMPITFVRNKVNGHILNHYCLAFFLTLKNNHKTYFICIAGLL